MASSDMEINLNVDTETMTIPRALYDHLKIQSWKMDFLADSIRRAIEDDERPSYRDEVDDKLVMRLTGMDDYRESWNRKKEAEKQLEEKLRREAEAKRTGVAEDE